MLYNLRLFVTFNTKISLRFTEICLMFPVKSVLLKSLSCQNRALCFVYVPTVNLDIYHFFSPTDAQLDNIKNNFKFV